ncbi:MAG: amino acid permease [Candidatus Thermoplasmatota archaeon]|nr:amino acid permease [Candidatus Thermoplasmatota archaeon]
MAEEATTETEGLDPGLEARASESGPVGKKYGTFAGVFTPTLLTILGVIMYLRLGWVVGNAGLLGSVGIILLAFTIVACTGLSMSSITTNIRIGGGGAYSIVSQSLGIEIGGSIGIPLYISQALAVSMYVFGFREGWLYVFPDHPALAVDMATFLLLFLVAFVSASLAFRIQYVIMAIIVGSLASVGIAAAMGSMVHTPELLGSFPGAPETGFQGMSFWAVFAVFFPAATGIMAGANMSGDLENPRESIPKGTMAAIVLSLVIYLALAYWLATSATTEELVSNYTIMIDRAFWGPIVIAGLLGATFSSALASLVGAPRILEALGAHNLLPKGDWLAQRSKRGEPHRAMVVTGIIVVAALMLRSLNAVAPLITMFFLITYAMVNVVVLIEQRLNLVSFRPLLRIPTAVPLIGAIGCITVMFIINATFGLAALVLVVGVYAYLVRRSLTAPYGDVRSGLFLSLTEWAAKRARNLPGSQERAWRPNLLVPVRDPDDVRRNFHFLRNLTYPQGLIKLLGVTDSGRSHELDLPLADMENAFREQGIFVTTTSLGARSYEEGVIDAMQTIRGSFFSPNALFLPLPSDSDAGDEVQALMDQATKEGLGTILFEEHPRAGLGRRARINLWLPDQGPDWEVSMDLGNRDLAILIAYMLSSNWNAELRVITHLEDDDHREMALTYLDRVCDLARLPSGSVRIALEGTLEEALSSGPSADLNIIPLGEELRLDVLREAMERTDSACVFTRDSGKENAFA